MRTGKISAMQAVMTVVLGMIGSATLIVPGGMIKAAAQDAWLAGVVAGAVTLISGTLWVALAGLWPGRDLFQITLAAAGPWLGRLILLLLLIWIYLIITGAVWIGGDAILSGFLPQTPRAVLCASLLIPAACAVRGGSEVVARLSQWIFWAIITLFLVLIGLSVPVMETRHLSPVLGGGIGPVLKAAEIPVGILAENIAIVALLPLVNGPVRPWRWLAATSVLAGGGVAVLSLWTVAILGPRLPGHFQYPVLMLAHLIGIGDILERLDALMMALWVAGDVAKAAFWYWLFCLGIQRLLELPEYRSLVWPAFLFILTGTLAWVESSPFYPPSLQAWTVLFTPLIDLAVPLGLLAATGLRRRQRRAAVS